MILYLLMLMFCIMWLLNPYQCCFSINELLRWGESQSNHVQYCLGYSIGELCHCGTLACLVTQQGLKRRSSHHNRLSQNPNMISDLVWFGLIGQRHEMQYPNLWQWWSVTLGQWETLISWFQYTGVATSFSGRKLTFSSLALWVKHYQGLYYETHLRPWKLW